MNKKETQPVVEETQPPVQPEAQQPSMANVAELKAYAYDLLSEIEQKSNVLRQVNAAIQQAQQEIANTVNRQQS